MSLLLLLLERDAPEIVIWCFISRLKIQVEFAIVFSKNRTRYIIASAFFVTVTFVINLKNDYERNGPESCRQKEHIKVKWCGQNGGRYVIESTLIKFTDDTKLDDKVNTSEGITILQIDLGRLEKWTSKNSVKFKKGKCQILHLGWNNQKAQFRLSPVWLRNNLAERPDGPSGDMRVLVDNNKLNMSQQNSIAATKGNQTLGGILGPLMEEIETWSFHSPHHLSGWYPKGKKDTGKERVQRRATKMIKGLEKLPQEKRLKQLDFCTLDNRKLRADLITIF
ncbi:hypothetical protein BTVI_53419 [Pitangus sulphuratus]|nr:hypothetical protein BTVI_53419 [Pitangus sulphuratus]